MFSITLDSHRTLKTSFKHLTHQPERKKTKKILTFDGFHWGSESSLLPNKVNSSVFNSTVWQDTNITHVRMKLGPSKVSLNLISLTKEIAILNLVVTTSSK